MSYNLGAVRELTSHIFDDDIFFSLKLAEPDWQRFIKIFGDLVEILPPRKRRILELRYNLRTEEPTVLEPKNRDALSFRLIAQQLLTETRISISTSRISVYLNSALENMRRKKHVQALSEALGYPKQEWISFSDFTQMHNGVYPPPSLTKVQEEQILEQTLAISLSSLKLSVRTVKCLNAMGVVTVRDLVTKNEQELLKFRNLGRKSLSEIKKGSRLAKS